MEQHFITHEECEAYRKGIYKTNNEQDKILERNSTEIEFLKKISYSILGVLVSGFVGVIFSVLSLK